MEILKLGLPEVQWPAQVETWIKLCQKYPIVYGLAILQNNLD